MNKYVRKVYGLKLEELRKEIDETDSAMAALFVRRMKLCAEIAEYKEKNGMAIFNKDREAEVLARCEQNVPKETAPFYKELLKEEMRLSKMYQKNLLCRLPDNIVIKSGCIKNLSSIFNLERKALVVTDFGVPKEYAVEVAKQCSNPQIITLESGEGTKSFKTVEHLCTAMLKAGFNRNDCVVAVGGGVVGDIAGFAASCYMRGIDFYNVPTTLLAQVDASVGGKTAANLCGIKNAVGAFYRPKAVAVDPDLLNTLSERQYKNGMAEVIKTAACLDKKLFDMLEHGVSTDNIEEVIRRCLFDKQRIVEADEHEKGLRRVLNFGHTIGHAVESAAKGSLLHGECVAIGMPPMCDGEEAALRLNAILKKYGLDLTYDGEIDKVFAALEHDKKAESDGINAVVLKNIGEYEFRIMSVDEIKRRFKEMKK